MIIRRYIPPPYPARRLRSKTKEETIRRRSAAKSPPGLLSVSLETKEHPPPPLAPVREIEAEGIPTVKCADLVTPPYSAEIFTAVELDTAAVETGNEALALPSGTVKLAGTIAAEGLSLDRDITAPPAGAAPLSITVPVELLPPTTEK